MTTIILLNKLTLKKKRFHHLTLLLKII